jgi:hypothetical protein
LFANVLELGDFVTIAVLILLLAGGTAVATRSGGPAAGGEQLRRIEQKVDLILTNLGINYVPPPRTAWQELADDPNQKIAAIKAYREEHGVGLADAKKAVEDYIDGRG